MVRKQIDNRIRVLIENGVKMKHRTMFVIVGDKGRDQVKLILKTPKTHFLKFLFFQLRCRFFITCWKSLQSRLVRQFFGATRIKTKQSPSKSTIFENPRAHLNRFFFLIVMDGSEQRKFNQER